MLKFVNEINYFKVFILVFKCFDKILHIFSVNCIIIIFDSNLIIYFKNKTIYPLYYAVYF